MENFLSILDSQFSNHRSRFIAVRHWQKLSNLQSGALWTIWSKIKINFKPGREDALSNQSQDPTGIDKGKV
jgi:hypothetical protein